MNRCCEARFLSPDPKIVIDLSEKNDHKPVA